jgi:hypothetical protein
MLNMLNSFKNPVFVILNIVFRLKSSLKEGF